MKEPNLTILFLVLIIFVIFISQVKDFDKKPQYNQKSNFSSPNKDSLQWQLQEK